MSRYTPANSMLSSLHKFTAAVAPLGPKKDLITTPIRRKNKFETRVFNALLDRSAQLGIAKLWHCTNARMDGIIETIDREIILLEIKETLGFGQFQAACFELLAGRHLLGIGASKGLIVFGRFSEEWTEIKRHDAWSQFCIHASEICSHIKLDAMQLTDHGFVVQPCYAQAA